MLYLFTDGVNEAENQCKEQSGDERLALLLKSEALHEPEQLVEQTFDDVKRYADGTEQSDDITIMCIKYI